MCGRIHKLHVVKNRHQVKVYHFLYFSLQHHVRFSTAKIMRYVDHQRLNKLVVNVQPVLNVNISFVEVTEKLIPVSVNYAEYRV